MNLKSLFNNKEVKNAGWLIGGRICQMLLSLVVSLLTARYLGPSNYGLINYGTAYVSFFTALSNLGINSVIIKDFVDHPSEQGRAIGSAILLRAISSILSVFMIVGIVSIIDASEPLTVGVVALCSIGLVFHIFETFNFWFQLRYESKVTAIATLVAYSAMSFYKILLLIAGKGILWFAAATSVEYAILGVLLLIAYKRHHGPKLHFSLKKGLNLLRSSYHYILSSMMVAVYGQTDKLMLKQMMDDSSVGFYAVATSICSMWTFVLQAIIDSLYPTILQAKQSDHALYNKKNRQLYAIVFYVSCFVSVVFFFLGDFLVALLFGDDYIASSDILKVVTWYTAFSYLGVARNAWIVSEGNQRYLKYMYGCAALLNVVLNLVLIPIAGAIGAAVASLVTQVCTSILLPLLIKPMRPNAQLMLEAIILKNVF